MLCSYFPLTSQWRAFLAVPIVFVCKHWKYVLGTSAKPMPFWTTDFAASGNLVAREIILPSSTGDCTHVTRLHDVSILTSTGSCSGVAEVTNVLLQILLASGCQQTESVFHVIASMPGTQTQCQMKTTATHMGQSSGLSPCNGCQCQMQRKIVRLGPCCPD